MKNIRILSAVGSAASMVMLAQAIHAEPAGTVLFAQEGAQIISASGASRPARRGDQLQVGEQLTTSANGISQVKLTDGSLVGIRPGSQLRMDAPMPASTLGPVVSLLQGTVRVIGAELMDKQKPSALTLQTGQATLQLNGADLESTVVRSGGRNAAGSDGRSEPRPPMGSDQGSYNRLIVGAGNLRSGNAVEPLVPRQVSFVAAGNPVPVLLAAMPPTPSRDGAASSPVGRSPTGSVDVSGAAKPPIASALPSGSPPAGPPALLPMTSTLTVPRLGPATGSIGMPLPGGPPPNFSPIATNVFPGGPKGPASAMPIMAPARGGGPGNIGPMGPPINMRPPVICTPSPIPGKPPICK